MGRYNYAQTPAVEETLALSIQWLKNEGYLNNTRSGIKVWNQFGKSFSVFVKSDLENEIIYLSYVHNSDPVKYGISLTCTHPHFGGKRYYFICPNMKCGKKVYIVYLPLYTKYFACRKCHKLQYTSSRKSGTRYMILKRKLKELPYRERLHILDQMFKQGDLTACELLINEYTN